MRNISFTVIGQVDTKITITETLDGKLEFELGVLGDGEIGDLGSLFFDLTDPDSNSPLDLSSLSVSPTDDHDDITRFKAKEAGVTNLGKGQNVNGTVVNQLGAFDAGIRFGTPGIGKDDIRETSFVLSSADGPLSLDMIGLNDLALRYTSVGSEGGRRNDSAKIAGQTGAVATDDMFSAEENSTGSVNVLINDQNGATRQIAGAADGDGDFSTVALGFERLVVVDGRVLGTLLITTGGVAEFTADGADVDALALGETAEYSFVYTSADGDATATANVKLTVIGTNDAPVFSIETGDSADETVDETNSGLTSQGYVTLSDADVSDMVSVALVSTSVSGNHAHAPSVADLAGMLDLAPAEVLGNGETRARVLWTFDSGTEAFDNLAVGEELTISYLIRGSDDSGAANDSGNQLVSVTIAGSNDKPEISVEIGDSVTASLLETGSEISATGSLALADIDEGDMVGVSVTGLTVTGDITDPAAPDLATLHAMLHLPGVAVLDATEQSDSFKWTFASGAETFAYLITGQELILTYEITADDGRGLSNSTDTQEVEIKITGTNTAPDITVETGDSATAVVDEKSTGVVASGTLTVTDPDIADKVSVEIVSLSPPSSTNPLLPDLTDLQAMLSLSPMTVLDGTATTGSLTWSFDSGAESFDFLKDGETVVLDYLIRAMDDSGSGDDTDDQVVSITINGKNGPPVISVETHGAIADSDMAVIDEIGPNLYADGRLTVRDPDVTERVMIDVKSLEATGALSDSRAPDNTALLGMMSFVSNFAVAETGTEGRPRWIFDSGTDAFDYLKAGETVQLVYEVEAVDDAGLTDTQLVTVIIKGQNDTPHFLLGGDVADILETNAPLEEDGTLNVRDLDTASDLTAEIRAPLVTGNKHDPATPSLAELNAMMTIDATPSSVGSTDAEFDWNFNSAPEAFDYLAVGESLNLYYTAVVGDGAGGNASKTVAINIDGTNDAPEITRQAGDVTYAHFNLDDLMNADLDTESGLSLGDLDTSDIVSLKVTARDLVILGDEPVVLKEDPMTLFNLTDSAGTSIIDGDGNQITGSEIVGSGANSGRFKWTFDASHLPPFIPIGHSVVFKYDVVADDGNGGTDRQIISIELNASENRQPVLTTAGANVRIDEDTGKPTHGPAGPGAYTLSTSGQMKVQDPDIDDEVSLRVKDVLIAGVPVSGLTTQQLKDMLILPASPVLDGTETVKDIDWSFQADAADFAFILPGTHTKLRYIVEADDGVNTPAESTIEVQIDNFNMAPDINVNGAHTQPLYSGTENQGFSENGMMSVRDGDQIDSVNLGVSAFYFGAPGAPGPSEATMLAWLNVSGRNARPETIVENDSFAGDLDWSFDISRAAYSTDYLSLGEWAVFEYTLTVDDGEGGTDSHALRFQLDGVDDPTTMTNANVAVTETDAPLQTSFTTTISDADIRDVLDISLSDVVIGGSYTDTDSNGQPLLPTKAALLAMLKLAAEDSTLQADETSRTLNWTFDSGSDTFNFLAEGETVELTYFVVADKGASLADGSTVKVTINGSNDQPVAEDVLVQTPLDGTATPITGLFVGHDEDAGDTLSYNVLGGVATDSESGTTYSVVNSNMGGWSVTPTGDLLTLDPGEVRTLTFDYQAVDNSGVVGGPGLESDTSETATGTIQVWGGYENTDTTTHSILFETDGQSQFYTGKPSDAKDQENMQLIDLGFIGVEQSVGFDKTWGGQKFENGTVTDIIGGLSTVVDAIADLGCTVVGAFGGDCDVDVEIPSSVTLPSVRLDVDVDTKVGLQPVFQAGSGELGGKVPLDVTFNSPQEVTIGEAFVLESSYTLGDGTRFTAGPADIFFGLDMIFDLDARARVILDSGKLGSKTKGPSKTVPLFDENVSETINLITIGGDPDQIVTSDVIPDPALHGTEEDFNAHMGNFFNPSMILDLPKEDLDSAGRAGETIQEGKREDRFLEVNADIDALISDTVRVVPPMEINYSIPEVSFDAVPGGSGGKVTLMKGAIALEILDVDLAAGFSLLQDFRMDIEDIPMLLTFEDSTEVRAKLGEAVIIEADTLSDTFDFGQSLDYEVDVDMEAVMDSLNDFGFDLQLFVGLLKGQVNIKSDFLPDIDINLFDTPGKKDSDGNEFTASDGYAWRDLIELINDNEAADVFDNEDFAVTGWSDATGADIFSQSISIA